MFNAPTLWGAKFFSITNSTKVGGWKVVEMDTYSKASRLISPFLWLGSFHVPHKGPFYKADFRWKRCIVETVHLCGTITCDLRSFVESNFCVRPPNLAIKQKISSLLCSATFFKKNSSACSFCLLGGQWEVPWTSYHLLSACCTEKKDASA